MWYVSRGLFSRRCRCRRVFMGQSCNVIVRKLLWQERQLNSSSYVSLILHASLVLAVSWRRTRGWLRLPAPAGRAAPSRAPAWPRPRGAGRGAERRPRDASAFWPAPGSAQRSAFGPLPQTFLPTLCCGRGFPRSACCGFLAAHVTFIISSRFLVVQIAS